MSITEPEPSERPGRHERHLLRRYGNPLFAASDLGPADLAEARRQDRDEANDFLGELRELVQRAVDLKPNEDSEVVLALKEALDMAYERASGLGGDQSGNREAIRQLLIVIMNAVRGAASDDPKALAELDAEDEARALHFRLLEEPLVADLLAPDSPIAPDELAATLLSESETATATALSLFDSTQLELLYDEARALLAAAELGREPRDIAEARLEQIRAARDSARSQPLDPESAPCR